MKLANRWLATALLVHSLGAFAEEAEEELDLVKLLQADLSVVSATKTKQTLAESPAVIAVVTRAQIEANDYRSVAEALQTIPGLYVNSDYVFSDVGVRGISGELNGNSQLVKVMVNNQPIALRNDHTNLLGPEAIPMDIVERIEVIRGPASALYGANAFLGVINVITRSGASLDGARIHARASTFNGWRPGYDLQASLGKTLGPLDLAVSLNMGVSDRSGLTLPCGTLASTNPDRCAAQKMSSGDPSVFDRKTSDDLSRPFSLFGKARLDLGHLIADDDARYGVLSLSLLHQHLDSRANFSPWSVMQSARYLDADGNDLGPVRATSNRVGLDNTIVRGDYELGLFRDRVSVSLFGAYATSGVSDTDLTRDNRGTTTATGGLLERSRYGNTGLDVGASVRWTILENVGRQSHGLFQGVTLVDNVTLIASADQTTDRVTLPINSFSVPVTFATSPLTNRGVSGQLTAAFLNKRVGLVAGARYDTHQGAVLTEDQLARYVGDREQLCGQQVCYSSFNYRGGITATLLRNVGTVGGRTAIDELYVKVLYGTAFKAPAPSFLYDDGYFGALPLKPNAGLRPQNVSSFEAVVGVSAFQKALSGTLVFFSSRLDDRVAFRTVPGGVSAKNAEPVQSLGVEATLGGKVGWVDFSGGLAWQSSQTQFDRTVSGRITDTFGFPDLSGALNAGVTVEPIRTRFGATLRGVGRRVGSPLNSRTDLVAGRYELAPYALVDLSVRAGSFNLFGESRGTTVTLSVRNLFNSSYQYSGFQPFYRTDIPGEPRALFLGIDQAL